MALYWAGSDCEAFKVSLTANTYICQFSNENSTHKQNCAKSQEKKISKDHHSRWIPYQEHLHLHHAQWEVGMSHDDHSKLHGVMESIHPKQEKQNEYAYIVEIVFS